MDVYLASQAAGLAARTLEWEGEGTEGDEQLYLRIGRVSCDVEVSAEQMIRG